MAQPRRPQIVCLSNIYDQHYLDARSEKVERSLTTPYRADLFQCLQMASGRELVVLSSPPKALERRRAKWLPAVETEFAGHRQLFCANWDIPKLRVPLSWFFYARHVVRYVQSGDLVAIDNYEFIYIFAAWLLKLFRKVKFILIYLDGKHLIDHGWNRLLSGLAESMGRSFLDGAILSNPSLGKRLPDSLPTELAPGFVTPAPPKRSPDENVRFLYAGRIASSHGIDLLLEALDHLPEKGWHLTIAGQGPLAQRVISRTQDPRWHSRLEYRPAMPPDEFEQLLQTSHVGLNCQRSSNPISDVTFPSKVFTYLSGGLLVISSKAGCVAEICGKACFYYHDETPESLAEAMKKVVVNFSGVQQTLNPAMVSEQHSFPAARERIQRWLGKIGIPLSTVLQND